MQSGYGGASEIQQFMVDGCPTSLFSISNSSPAPSSAEIQKFHPLTHPQVAPPHMQQEAPPPQPPPFVHFGYPIPITQQLFHQAHHHHHHHHPHPFQLFHHQQQHLRLDQESGPEHSTSPTRMMGGAAPPGGGGGPSFLAAMDFKLGVDESSGGQGSRDGLNDDDGILQGDDGSESRLHHSWHREEESAAAAAAANIKEPFWRPLDIDYINPNNKRAAKEKQPEISSSNVKHFKKNNESLDHNQAVNNNTNAAAAATTSDSNYKLFNELEAIYKPGGTPTSGGGGGGCGGVANNQTGSGSALTGDDNPLMRANAPGPTVEHGVQPDNVSDTSNGAAGRASPTAEATTNRSGGHKKQRSKRRRQMQLTSITTFFESLVKQLMDHQEGLHRKFLEIMEKRDKERTNREDAWRKQEATKAKREAAARAQQRALAAAREAAIIAFLEKITSENLNLPPKSQFTEESQKEHDDYYNALEPYNTDTANNNNANGSVGGGIQAAQLNSSRWPEEEVQVLIRVRSRLEWRFQEPGLKGPLWEEVSMEMGSMGYQRSSKRCKEKWENINKYFRKTKDSGKKRPQHSKTCPYFHQLDQLYSKSSAPNAANANTNNVAAASTPSSSNAKDNNNNSELLDAIVVFNEDGKRINAEFNDVDDNEEEGQGESQ